MSTPAGTTKPSDKIADSLPPAQPAKQRDPFRELLPRLVVLIVAIVIVAVAIGIWRARRTSSASDHLLLYGNVDFRQSQLAFNDSERITALLVQEGAGSPTHN